MKKQHKYILKAFVNTRIPKAIRRYAPDFIMVDTCLGGYCSQILSKQHSIKIDGENIIDEEDKRVISDLINRLDGEDRDELIFYYRLAVLAETIVNTYRVKD